MGIASRLLPFIPLIPAISALVLTLFGRAIGRARAGKLASGAVGVSFVLAAISFAEVTRALPAERMITVELFDWISLGSFRAAAALVLDPLSSIMILVVTGVGLLIHVYSLGYMEEDRDVHRYFAYLNLFTAFMLLLVLAENLLVMFVGWEGVGLCSYLLIGYWYERKEAIDAGLKAFIVNRIGDLGFLFGILMTFVVFGTLSFQEFLPLAPTKDTTVLSVIGILLFVGAIGKSAQIPLHVWLPDAVAGPMPVSALMNAATIVTAGIYMVARTAPLYAEAPLALGLVGAIGAVTLLFAATIALAQRDLRQVLAYSTISQLGYMFLACGVGAFGVAVFHLVTHAFGNALLFLCAGSVMHAMAGRTDIRKMGGLKEKLPITYRTFVIATLALTGVPPFAGFFSKNQILWSAFRDGYFFLWAVGVVGTFLAAFYLGRLWMLVFEGRFRGDSKPFRQSPASMTWPLRLLAVGSVVVGFIGIPHYNGIESFLTPYLAIGSRGATSFAVEGTLMFLNVVVAAAGLFLARRVYLVAEPGPSRRTAQEPGRLHRLYGLYSLYRLLEDKCRVDELYDLAILRPLAFFSRTVLWRGVDRRIVDAGFHGSARLIRAGGEGLRLFQSGNLRIYLFVLFAGVVAILGWLILGARWAS